MTFRGLGIWDLGIMTRVGVRKLGEIDGLGLEQSSNGLRGTGADQRTGRTREERGPGFGGTQ